MGGMNSGRHGARPAIDSGLILDVNKLSREGFLDGFMGSLLWRNGYGEIAATIGFEGRAEANRQGGYCRLTYTTTTFDGQKRHHDYRVSLVSTAQPFGGRRWWFRCGTTGGLAQRLYMPAGAMTFQSRQAYGRRGYSSQRRSAYDQAIDQAFKLRRQLGDQGAIDDPVWKPKWMRRRTFNRKVARIDRVEARVNNHLAGLMARLGGLL